MTVVEQPYHCPNCGAICEADERTCWHCDAPLASRPPNATYSGADDSRLTSSSFSLAALVMAMTVASIALGIAVLAPCVGVPLALLLLIAWARTAMAVQLLKRQDYAPETGETFGLYFRAVYTTLVVLVLMAIILYASFWLAAIVAWGTSALLTKLNFNRDAGAFLSGLVGLVAGGVAIAFPAFRWLIRNREEMFAVDPYNRP